jgi:hypothetical protein
MGDTYPKRHHGTQDLCRIERFDRLLTSVCRTIILMIMQPLFSVFLRGVDGFFVIALLMFFAGCNPSQHDTAAASPAPGRGVPSIQFSQASGFEGVREGGNAKITQAADGLQIHASDDPQLLLPRLEVTGNDKWVVHVQISSPSDTGIQIFYDTTKNAAFDEAHSVRKPIRKGDNDVTMEINDSDFGGNLRLDPGDMAGEYLIKLIEVRPTGRDSSAPSPAASP